MIHHELRKMRSKRSFKIQKVAYDIVSREKYGHLHVTEMFSQPCFVVRLYRGGLDLREQTETQGPKRDLRIVMGQNMKKAKQEAKHGGQGLIRGI